MIQSFSWARSADDVLSTTLDRLWLPEWRAGMLEMGNLAYYDSPAGRAAFYLIQHGTWRLALPEAARAVHLAPGDAVVLPHGITHRLSRVEQPTTDDIRLASSSRCMCGNDASASLCAHVVFGSYSTERALSSSFELGLPELIHIAGSAHLGSENTSSLAELVASECHRAEVGTQAVVNRLVQVLLLQTLRTFARDQYCKSAVATDWLRAALDPEIGGALNLIHTRPEQPWTVQSLAGQIHMSRSAFAERFRQLVGDSPLQYLTKCRMQKAGRMLRETELGVKEIAAQAGYESVTSFSSAFKRQTGTSPAAFRKGEHVLA